MNVSKKNLLILAILSIVIVVTIYVSYFLGVEFSDVRLKLLCRLAVFFLPYIIICIFLIFGPMWLKVVGGLFIIPHMLIVLLGLHSIPADLSGLWKGEDPNMILLSKKRINSGYLCRYYVGMNYYDVREIFSYETSFAPALIKAETIDSVYPDYDEYDHIMDGFKRRSTMLDFTREAKDFHSLLQDGLESYFRHATGHNMRVEYELFSSSPTQIGIALPKYYAWVKGYVFGGPIEQGAVEVAAIDKTRFAVVRFLDRDVIEKYPEFVKKIFPNKICKTIFDKARNEAP